MATFKLTTPKYPVSTSVSAWKGDPPPGFPSTGPPGTAADTATVAADNTLTFTALLPGEKYTLWATGVGYETIVVDQPAVAAGWKPDAVLYETFGRQHLPGNITAPTSGTLTLAGGIIAKKGVACSSLSFFSGTTALGTGTHQWFCLARVADAQIVAVTADDTSTAWGANSKKTLSFGTAWTPDVDTPVWAGLLVTASQQPSLLGLDHNAVQDAVRDVVPRLSCTADTSLTVPLAAGVTLGARTISRQQAYAQVA